MTTPDHAVLTRPAASSAVEHLGWRLVLGEYLASVPVPSLRVGTAFAASVIDECGDDADAHLRLDLRPDRVEMSLQTRIVGGITGSDVDLASRLTEVMRGAGLSIAAPTAVARPVQRLECAIDAMDIAAIRPFWKAVLGYVDEPGTAGDNALVDPVGLGPCFWFQQLDEPRPQRNRIHFDITVAHDEAEARIAVAVAAGGTLISDAAARSFWILADVEANEICVCTWQDRERG